METMQSILGTILQGLALEEEAAMGEALDLLEEKGERVTSVRTFEEAELLTYDTGFVVRLQNRDGTKSEFQITIVQSR